MCKFQETFRCPNGHEAQIGPENWLRSTDDENTLHRPTAIFCMEPWEDDICGLYKTPVAESADDMWYGWPKKW